MIDKSAIDPNALQFYRMLKESGFSAYFVGGSVRDLLLGKEPKDFDIATNATPQQIKRVIPQGRIIGRRFRHVMLEKNGGRYEIVTFRGPVVPAELEQAALEDESIEAPAANEAEEGNGRRPRRDDSGRDRERRYPDLNQFGNAEQDALRRDFTINALFYDPDADELVDYVEGKLDIDRRIIRTIGEAANRMEEDPIRILRAIRHKMKLGLDYDPALEAAMRDKAPMLTDTSKDRIREEFLKVCNDQSMVDFLKESQRLGLAPFIMPWFEEAPDESWNEAAKLWEKFREADLGDRPSPDLGLALMMIPLVEPLVLKPYRESLKEGEQNYLPDMKYFLSCEPLRNFYLRNLRISRAQTDYLVRALFYYHRMNGLWMEQGPPRRIVGRLFQHPSAVLAAKMSRLNLQLEGKEVPEWLAELADFDPNKRRRQGREGQEGRGGEREHRRERSRERSREEGAENENDGEGGGDEAQFDESEQDEPRERRPESAPREKKSQRLPPPDQPMVWNGPLHAPVLRPIFSEEPAIRWARKNQTVRAFRPSGIPNQPVDHSLLKSNLVYNYKPEMAVSERGDEAEGERGNGQGGSGRGRRRERGRGRGRDRDRERGNDRNGGNRGERGDRDRQASRSGPNSMPAAREQDAVESGSDSEMDAYDTIPATVDNRSRFERTQRQPRQQSRPAGDDDSIGNLLRPGEQPAPLGGMETDYADDGDDSDIDDNIGNRLDAPPTSGHVGVNGDGFLSQRGQGGGSGRNPPRGGGQGGGSGGGSRRRGRRRGRRGGGHGGGGGSGGGNRGQPRGNFNAQ